VLFLSLLLTLILTGLLLIEVERAAIEISMVGNERFARTGYHVAEGGLLATTAKASLNPQGFITLASLKNYKIDYADLGLNLFDRSSDGSFGREGPNAGIVNFSTSMTHPVTTNKIPGYALEGSCFQRYIWTTTSQYGLSTELGNPNASVNTAYRLSVQKARSVVYLGPVPCTL
jgi:hypothetical protein